MLHIANIPKNSSILDVSCGTGIPYEVLKEEGFNGTYVGTDLSNDMLEIGRKRNHGIDLRAMDCENLAFEDKSFDVVLMRSVLHHIPNPIKAVKEMNRIARKTIIIRTSQDYSFNLSPLPLKKNNKPL